MFNKGLFTRIFIASFILTAFVSMFGYNYWNKGNKMTYFNNIPSSIGDTNCQKKCSDDCNITNGRLNIIECLDSCACSDDHNDSVVSKVNYILLYSAIALIIIMTVILFYSSESLYEIFKLKRDLFYFLGNKQFRMTVRTNRYSEFDNTEWEYEQLVN